VPHLGPVDGACQSVCGALQAWLCRPPPMIYKSTVSDSWNNLNLTDLACCTCVNWPSCVQRYIQR
jgi:hypothetical protein